MEAELVVLLLEKFNRPRPAWIPGPISRCAGWSLTLMVHAAELPDSAYPARRIRL